MLFYQNLGPDFCVPKSSYQSQKCLVLPPAEKNLVPKVWAKMPIFWLGMVKSGYGQKCLWTLKLTVSQEWADRINWFFACWYKFMKVKMQLKIFGCDQSGDGTIKLTVSEEWTDGITDFLHVYTKIKNWSKIFWVGMVKNGCGKSGCGTLKLTVSQKLTDGTNWYFACWYKFRKAKSWFSDFWLGMVKKWPWPVSSWEPKICCICIRKMWMDQELLLMDQELLLVYIF